MRTIIPPEGFRQPMEYIFPPYNTVPFEEWFSNNYIGCDTERYFIDVWWTNYFVNQGYVTEVSQVPEVQSFIDRIDRNKKYFSICQYDHSTLVDFKDLDVLQFNMSVDKGICLPLICTPYEKRFYDNRIYKASFVGALSHPIRQPMLDAVKDMKECYFSTTDHDYIQYNRILARSVFALSPRGVGLSSFRCYSEAMYQGAIPVYISDKHIVPFGLNFDDFGVLVKESEIPDLPKIIDSFTQEQIVRKQKLIADLYNEYFSFRGCFDQIIKYLESE